MTIEWAVADIASGPAIAGPHLPRALHLDDGPPERMGRGPRLRRRIGHYLPLDWYEATVASLADHNTVRPDVACGRDLFPSEKETVCVDFC